MRTVAASGGEGYKVGRTEKGHKGTFCGDGNALYFHRGVDNVTDVSICQNS